MKKHTSSLLKLAIVSLTAFPAYALAAPTTGSAYYTDITNSYVQDQTSQTMSQVNNILCFMAAMAPNLMVNNGNYIALVDENTCGSSGGSGGQSNNTGPSYLPVVVNSARASTADPMLVKAWLTFSEEGTTENISVYASATQAPSSSLPYGVFRMDYCGSIPPDTTCAGNKGFINASSIGLTFFSAYAQDGFSGTTKLLLNASSSTAGSGAISDAYQSGNSTGGSDFLFAYNANYFVRNDQARLGTAGDLCFDRSPANPNADESVWRYGLYNDTTGARITRNSGFPIEYTLAGGAVSNGYIGYNGLWTQGAGPATGDTVHQVTYSSSGASKTPYLLLKTGGKLTKYTTATKTLADLNKITFWYYAQNNVGESVVVMTAGSQYELYWDNAASNFVVSGKRGETGNMEPLTPTPVTNAAMVAANRWGLFGWSQMMGGEFSIKGKDFSNLVTTTSTTTVLTQTQDIVYPTNYATELPNGLTCINDCPTKSLIDLSNAANSTSSAYLNPGWNPVSTFVNYTLGISGNLIDAALADVVSTATSGINSWGVRTGRMVKPGDMTTITTRKADAGLCGVNVACTFNQGDVNLLDAGSSYYVWETGAQPWHQLAILKHPTTGVAVTFDPPLQVSFLVPAVAKYGNYQGATIALQYGGFGDLWGIPNECIDVTTNAECNFSAITPTDQNNQRWASKFSIPFHETTGVVKANAGATTYLVKPLDKEIRLAKVDCATTAGGLTTSGLSRAGLPTEANWVNPSATVGTKPTVTIAPRVIHGVKQY